MQLEVREINLKETKQFINDNINRIGFMAGLYSRANIIRRGIFDNEKLVGIFVLTLQQKCTYLFTKDVTREAKEALILNALRHPHKTAEITTDDDSIIAKYYTITSSANLASLNQSIIGGEQNITNDIQELTVDRAEEYYRRLSLVFNSKHMLLEELEKYLRFVKVYFIEEDARIVSGISASPTGDEVVIISALFTNDLYRGRGFAADLIYHIVNEYKGKTISLYYNNPTAGKLYSKLGFKTYAKHYYLEKK